MNKNWTSHVNSRGDFELPLYLYKTINQLMKQSLDFGTLLSDDPAKLRAYKEMIKRTFKDKWFEVAEALEFFDIIEKCVCNNDFCEICGGSRYILSESLTPDEMREVSVIVGASEDKELADKLMAGLKKAFKDADMRKM